MELTVLTDPLKSMSKVRSLGPVPRSIAAALCIVSINLVVMGVHLPDFNMWGLQSAGNSLQEELQKVVVVRLPPTAEEKEAVALALSRTVAFTSAQTAGSVSAKSNAEMQGNSIPQQQHFPALGTSEFSKTCGSWATPTKPLGNCTFLANLHKDSSEGTSNWASAVVETHLLALQANCRILIQYSSTSGIKSPAADGIDLSQFFVPNNPLTNNWTVPHEFSCGQEKVCFQRTGMFDSLQAEQHLNRIQADAVSPRTVGPVPVYRFIYNPVSGKVANNKHFTVMESNLPGFKWSTGMACSFEALFKISPAASQFEPRLFDTLLPTLRNPHHFVIALYIRTHRADEVARTESKGKPAEVELNNSITGQRELSRKHSTECALKLEQQYLEEAAARGDTKYTKVVWMLISDSPLMKERVATAFHGQIIYLPASSTSISRQVLTTTSKGTHTRPKRSPTTADVAEAMIDWYLIGESHVVVEINSVSFGQTASLRTARPIYDGYKCQRLTEQRGDDMVGL
jgi:hypothetical protein